MKQLHAKRLLKLAAFLRTVPPRNFDYRTIITGPGPPEFGKCGSAACALGWAPAAFPRQLTWDDAGFPVPMRGPPMNPHDLAVRFFGLTERDAYRLFYPHIDVCPLPVDASAEQVAGHIERFVKRGGSK